MDVAATSIGFSLGQVKAQAAIQVMNKVMNISEQQGQDLIKMMMEQSVQPHLGGNVDVTI